MRRYGSLIKINPSALGVLVDKVDPGLIGSLSFLWLQTLTEVPFPKKKQREIWFCFFTNKDNLNNWIVKLMVKLSYTM